MHVLLDLSGLLVVVLLGGTVAFRLLSSFQEWSQRQALQLLVLLLPLVSIIVLFGGLLHVTIVEGMLSTPAWDRWLDILVLLVVAVPLLGALLLGVGRLILIKRLMRQQETLVDPALQLRTDAFASLQGGASCRVRLTRKARPLALIYGIRWPTVLLSTWMLEHLDQAELEAVLAHELGHVWRRDYLVNWMALVLRDAFFYLPTSRSAYRHFQCERELACDDFVVRLTHRPLALASALTKVWLHTIETPPLPLAQSLVGQGEILAGRIERLLSLTTAFQERQPASRLRRGGSSWLCAMLFLFAVSVAVLLSLLLCWPLLIP